MISELIQKRHCPSKVLALLTKKQSSFLENVSAFSTETLSLVRVQSISDKQHNRNLVTCFSNNHSSGIECWIDLEPGCKFKLVRCPKVYKKNLTNSDHQRPWWTLFYGRSSRISLAGSILGSILGPMKVQEGPLSLGRVP